MAEEPRLVNVKVAFELPIVPTGTVPKLKLVADGYNAAATPLRRTNCGLVESESLIVSVSLNGPVTVGRKTTLILQLFPAARLPLQSVLLTTKSGPFTVMLLK